MDKLKARIIQLDIVNGYWEGSLNGQHPTSVRLFKPGINETSKGMFIYDPQNKQQIIANQKLNDGRDLLPIDIAHNSLNPNATTPEAGISVGWWKLDIADDGIWARDIQWTDRGKLFLDNREYRFISPAFYSREEVCRQCPDCLVGEACSSPNNYISQITNFALTNEPATFNPLPLVAEKEKLQMAKQEQVETINKEEETISVDSTDEQTQLSTEEEEETVEEEEVLEEEALPVKEEEVDEAASELEAQVSSLQQKLEEALSLLAEKEAELSAMRDEQVAASKLSLIESLGNISERESKFLQSMELSKLQEWVDIAKEKPAVETGKADSPKQTKLSAPTPKSAPKSVDEKIRAGVVLNFSSLPSKEEIRKQAERWAQLQKGSK
jgi:hypothetical protein